LRGLFVARVRGVSCAEGSSDQALRCVHDAHACPRSRERRARGFYAAHAVDEVLIVDRQRRSGDGLALCDGHYRTIERSRLIDLGVADLLARIDWPSV
jgi:hypothetical protein